MTKELEVKVLNMDLNDIEEKIVSLGGRILAKEHQVNTLIDSSKTPIKTYLDAYFRIRETHDILSNTSTVTLTLKKNIKNECIRENIELNTNIEDKDVMLEILKDLGFDKVVEGFKTRISYELEGARLDLDRWDEKTYPYPYMEIEVENKEDLDRLINLLAIDNDNVSTKSIVELREEIGLE
ncbi:class IV adenylate cyclase [Paratissierella segnis]|jgi:adenylate cyclase class 2|uniref:Class IV adenylate cyclase n=1 Tax=Paratissierella segnis TaxID=2763679 RepID=A0A926EXJ4_9FIRM|nr:class IV adenylate cyclase [Paratissierella segnis]MBC8589416.1 class IV adenylate cyclase [Paratissierella segnis]